jgi:hypothetical protein
MLLDKGAFKPVMEAVARPPWARELVSFFPVEAAG